MKIAVIGTGYVGLVTATCFAEMGHEVIGVDIDAAKIDRLRRGESPLYEPGLEPLLKSNLAGGRLSFSTNLAEAVQNTLFCFIAVGTPKGEDGSADLEAVLSVARSVARSMTSYRVFVVKSTVPVGTCDLVAEAIRKELSQNSRAPEIDFDVVSNPEFLKEGAAVDDFLRPDRVIVGVSNPKVQELMKELYAPFVRNGHPVYFMDVRSSEMTKYASNAFLAMKVSFMNKMAQLCDEVGADVMSIRSGMGADPRIGMPFLYAGVGYGGSCFPKDVKALIHTGKRFGIKMDLLDEVERINQEQKEWPVRKLLALLGNLEGKRIALWGGAFKPETDDIREAPSLAVMDALLKKGADLSLYDPAAIPGLKEIYGKRVAFGDNAYSVLEGADALVLLTEWRLFRSPDWNRMRSLMKGNIVLDGRNQYEPREVSRAGFSWYGIGRGCSTALP
ncbi:MAG: UDP-glucose dehydrogenase family protein [Leptospirales bacterium]